MTKKNNKKEQLKNKDEYKIKEVNESNHSNNSIVPVENTVDININNVNPNIHHNNSNNPIIVNTNTIDSNNAISEQNVPKPECNVIVHKKRGRKPKGGKIICTNETVITTTNTNSKNIISEPNIILHLKCRKEDLDILVDENNITSVKYEPNIQNVENYHFDNSKSGELQYCMISSLDNNTNNISLDEQKISSSESKNNINNNININRLHDNKKDASVNNTKQDKNHITVTITNNSSINHNIKDDANDDTQEDNYNTNDASLAKMIRRKIKELSIQLHNNDIADKKSACFWCTFDFDNPPIYIPKYELNNTYYCYGCFCSPECATASLFKESIDISVKFERYHLLNHIYCKIYDYNKNIKPAPDPYYMLDKYYGNLTIQEYRRLLKNNRLILLVDKPFTRSLPELYDENDDYVINNKSIQPSNNTNTSKYKLRQSKNKNTKAKNTILNENFNF